MVTIERGRTHRFARAAVDDLKSDTLLAPACWSPSGTRYRVPEEVERALSAVLGEPDIGCIEVIYRPGYVRCHLAFIGGRTGSVTRPERIYTNLPASIFFALDRHLLHEYYHVVQQWRRERMTRIGYLLCSRRREQEARAFAAENLSRYRRLRQEYVSALRQTALLAQRTRILRR